MARRGSKRPFAGTVESHAVSYRQALADTDGSLRWIDELLERGSCRVAFRQLRLVTQRLGNLATSWTHSRGHAGVPDLRTEMEHRVGRTDRMWDRWVKHCVRPGRQ